MKVSFWFTVWVLSLGVNFASEIYLDANNKLQNAVAFINQDVPEGDGTLLRNIQTYLTQSSQSLLTATNEMDPSKSGVQFGTIYIVIPNSWKAATSGSITWQQCSKSDIIISTNKRNNYKEDPFTMQIGKCGQPGNYTRIPQSFFAYTDNEKVFVQGKRIMKEFVKLRYGVFSEEAFLNQLTIYNGSHFIQSTCGEKIKWELSNFPAECSDPNNKCHYVISKNQNHNYSIMFDLETPSSKYFCDDKHRQHNRLAKSIHNLKCDGRSISSVILSHADFQTNKTKTNFSSPTFVLLKNPNRKIVFVLDVSGSMVDHLKNMQLAVIEFISNVVEESAEFGLVIFGSNALKISNLLPMDQKSNKDILISKINSIQAVGNTNIPDGLRKGVEVLGGNLDDGNQLYGTIFLLTDGENNQEMPIWNDMSLIKKIVKKGLIANTIVYGNVVDDKLNSLAFLSGGRFVYADQQKSYSDLMSLFSYRQSCDASSNSSIKIIEGNKEVIITGIEDKVYLFHADMYMGIDMILRLMFSADISLYNITLLDANKKEFVYILSVKQLGVTTLTFKVPGNFQKGVYILKVRNLSSRRLFKRAPTTLNMTYMVSTSIDQNSSRIINPTGFLSQNEIEEVNSLTQVTATVDLSTSGIQTNERVSVLMIIKNTNKEVRREMRDDGLDCDSIGGDAIFTACIYPRDLLVPDFYIITANVTIYSLSLQDPIQRTVDLGSLRVKRVAATIPDRIPPAKINSVNLTIVDEKKRILKVEFLATGDDGLIGNISLYNVKVENKKDKEILNVTYETVPLFPVLVILDLSNVTANNASFTISVRGVDRAGNSGEWSPEQIYSWHYDEDRRKYNNVPGQNNLQSWSMGVCLMIIWIWFQ